MSEKEKRALVAQQRMDCHQNILDEVSESEHFDIRILKEPNKSKLHPASKVVVVVGTMEQAEQIRENCMNEIQQINSYINQTFRNPSLRYEIKYKINIIKASGDIFLSVRNAQSRKNIYGNTVIETLKSILNGLNESKDKELMDAIRKYIPLVNPDHKYTWAKSTGNNYRITYFDSDQSQRVQASVGNIMIVVGDSQTKIQDAPERKERADRKQPLFVLAVPLHGVISVYPAE